MKQKVTGLLVDVNLLIANDEISALHVFEHPHVGEDEGFERPHLMYAYMIENTDIYEIFERVMFEYFHGEKLGFPTADGTVRWLYAGLAKTDPCIKHGQEEKRWPTGLRRGAFLQLRLNDKVYEAVRDGQKEIVEQQIQQQRLGSCGHFCIFRGYLDNAGTGLVVADQYGPRKEWSWEGPSNTSLQPISRA